MTLHDEGIIVLAPLDAILGTFNPVITLSRVSDPTQFTTFTLTVTVLAPLITSLTFDIMPTATSFYFETELLNVELEFNLPQISWQPSNAD